MGVALHSGARPAFSDVRRLIADEALSDHFLGLWPNLCQPLHKSFTKVLMRMVA
jgi:hypothetical protein